MIKKIPKEEFEALFEEIYKVKGFDTSIKEETQTKLKPVYIFYGYKILRIFNKIAANVSVLPVLIKNFEIEKTNNTPEIAHFGFDIENKYRFFVSLDENGILFIEEFLKENMINIENLHSYVIESFKSIFEKMFNELNLKTVPVSSTLTKFYSLQLLNIKFFAKVLDENITLNVYLDEPLFESENISKYILINPSTKELQNLSKLLTKVLN